jgi:hypothetical protein
MGISSVDRINSKKTVPVKKQVALVALNLMPLGLLRRVPSVYLRPSAAFLMLAASVAAELSWLTWR